MRVTCVARTWTREAKSAMDPLWRTDDATNFETWTYFERLSSKLKGATSFWFIGSSTWQGQQILYTAQWIRQVQNTMQSWYFPGLALLVFAHSLVLAPAMGSTAQMMPMVSQVEVPYRENDKLNNIRPCCIRGVRGCA